MSNNVWDLHVYSTNLLIDTVPNQQKTDAVLESMGLNRKGNYAIMQILFTSAIRQRINSMEDPELTEWKTQLTKDLKDGLEANQTKVIAMLNLQPMTRTIIIQLSNNETVNTYKEIISKGFEAMSKSFYSKYNYKVIGCSSKLFTDFFNINTFYKNVRQLQTYHYCIGKGCNVFYDDMNMMDGPVLIVYKHIHLLDKLLLDLDWDGATKLVYRITENLKEHPVKNTKTTYIYKEMYAMTIRKLFEKASVYQHEIQQLNDGITMFDEIFDDIEQMQSYYLDIIKLLSVENTSNGLNAYIKKTVDIVHNKYKEPLTLEGVADKVGISSAYLSRLFKSEMNMNFKTYLTDFRINLAKNALLETNNKIKAIQNAVGYYSQSQFARAFNKSEGMPPSEYRQYYKQINK